MATACALLGATACRKTGGLPGLPDDRPSAGSGTYDPGATARVDGSIGHFGGNFSVDALLGGVAACVVDGLTDFDARTDTLRTAADAYAAEPTPERRAAARRAWEAAMDRWQQLELFQFGPASPTALPGGEDLRDEIYIWPTSSRCFVEQVLASDAYAPGSLESQFAYARDLGALDYLLFSEATENDCAAGNVINTGGKWEALVASGLEAARANYAASAASEVHRHAAALSDAWSSSGGGFATELTSAGSGSQAYPNLQDALDAIGAGLFYLDTETKDMKLGIALGLNTCATQACTESPFAGRSRINVLNNLIGFQTLFFGCEAAGNIGFDDMLVDYGRGELAAEMTALVADAIDAAAAIETGNLETAVAADRRQVEALYEKVQLLTTALKSDLVATLNLQPPNGMDGDND